MTVRPWKIGDEEDNVSYILNDKGGRQLSLFLSFTGLSSLFTFFPQHQRLLRAYVDLLITMIMAAVFAI